MHRLPRPLLLFAAALLASVLLSAVSSRSTRPDILPQGSKGITHTHRLIGLDAFPGYRFLHAPVHLQGWKFLEEGKPFSWYKLHGTRVYAVKQGLAVPAEYDKNWLADLPQTAQELQVQSAIDAASPVMRRNTVHKLTSVTADAVELTLVEDQYLDKDGKVIANQAPVGATPGSPREFSWILLVSVGAIVVLVLLVAGGSSKA